MNEQQSKDELERYQASLMTVKNETIIGKDYSKMKTPQFTSIGSKFINCRFDSMRVDCAAFASGATLSCYIDCSFDGIRIKRVLGGIARFERCSFKNVAITGWSLEACDLVDCVFTGQLKAGRYGGSFWGTPTPYWQKEYKKTQNEFRGNDFSGCSLVNMDFRMGVDLRLQVLPQGPNYLYIEDGAHAVEHALESIKNWEDEKLRNIAKICLELLLDKIMKGQEQIFISNMSGYLAPIWPQLCEVLTGK